jgi:glycosyltransferase involved in cell wall biosynthesis
MSSSGAQLRVVMTTPRFSPDVGGVENHVLEVARRLIPHNVEVTVVTAGAERGLPPAEVVQGVRVVRLSALPRRGDLGFAPSLPRVLRSQRPDIVHVQSYHTFMAPLSMATALASRRPYVVTFHGGGHSSRLRSTVRPLQMRALRPLLRRSERLIATARFEIVDYGGALGLGPERFAYVPNGSDLPAFHPTSAPDPHLIVSIGRLERYKGHHRAIEALPHVLETDPEARLWIAGEGSYESELVALAGRLGVSDRVEIRAIPVTERARFASELSRARVALLLSEFETHPMAALEAAALGVALVVLDGSGLSELVADGLASGLPETADPREVAAAILAAMRRPIPSELPRVPTWDDCALELATIYRSIARSGSTARTA